MQLEAFTGKPRLIETDDGNEKKINHTPDSFLTKQVIQRYSR